MKRVMIYAFAFLALMSGMAFAQDVDMLIGKIKGAKKLSSKVYIKTEADWGDPILEVVREWNEQGDLTLQGGFGSEIYTYTYDDRKRKKTVVKKDGRGCLQSKSAYTYAADGSFELSEDQYMGDKPGQEERSRTATSRYGANGLIFSRKIKDQLFGVIDESYGYDEKWHLISMKTEYDGGSENRTYKNDARGNPLEIVNKDANGKLIGRETSAWDEKDFLTLFCEYDTKDRLSKKIGVAYSSYNDHGHPKLVAVTVFDDGKPDQAKFNLKVDIEYEYYPKK